jgi:hypothetical protein
MYREYKLNHTNLSINRCSLLPRCSTQYNLQEWLENLAQCNVRDPISNKLKTYRIIQTRRIQEYSEEINPSWLQPNRIFNLKGFDTTVYYSLREPTPYYSESIVRAMSEVVNELRSF